MYWQYHDMIMCWPVVMADVLCTGKSVPGFTSEHDPQVSTAYHYIWNMLYVVLGLNRHVYSVYRDMQKDQIGFPLITILDVIETIRTHAMMHSVHQSCKYPKMSGIFKYSACARLLTDVMTPLIHKICSATWPDLPEWRLYSAFKKKKQCPC